MRPHSELVWQAWVAPWAGFACATSVIVTIPFPRFTDYLLFLAYGAVLGEVALFASWGLATIALLPLALVTRRSMRAAASAAQITRWLLVAAPSVASVPIALNRCILWGEPVDLFRPSVLSTLAIGLGLSGVVALFRAGVIRLLARQGGARSLAIATVVVILLTSVLGWQGSSGRLAAPVPVTSDPRVQPPTRPILVVGIDSLGYDTLSEVASAYSLPTFERLLSHGAVYRTVGPSTNSCELFASVATAAPPAEHGVQTHFHVKFPGITSFPLHYKHRNLWLASMPGS